MFQSSSTASGSPGLQTSSASSPPSASTSWKSRPSRIRRATLRITLESSTTRHVFIFGLLFLQFPNGDVSIQYRFAPERSSRRHHGRREFEHAIDIEDDHELAVEAVNAAGEFGHAGIEVDGVFLAAVVGEPEHFADLVDQRSEERRVGKE